MPIIIQNKKGDELMSCHEVSYIKSSNQTTFRQKHENLFGVKKEIKSFTLIELLVVIAIIAILPRSKNSFFLPFSAI